MYLKLFKYKKHTSFYRQLLNKIYVKLSLNLFDNHILDKFLRREILTFGKSQQTVCKGHQHLLVIFKLYYLDWN